MKRQVVSSNWRDELSEYVNINNVTPKTPKTSDRAGEKVEEKKVNNKVVINPTMSEAFEELGGTIISIEEKLSQEEIRELQNKKDKEAGRKPGKVEENLETLELRRAKNQSQLAKTAMMIAKKKKAEVKSGNKDQSGEMMQQVKEKLNIDNANMGDVIKDFYKSDAPQFKGKSKEKRRQMAIAAKLEADGKPLKSESAALDYMRSKYKDSLITPSSKPKAPSKKELDRRAANRAANQKSGPMAQDPYKSRAGESD